MMSQLPQPSTTTNPFEEAYECGLAGVTTQTQIRDDLREKVEAAKEKAEATEKIAQVRIFLGFLIKMCRMWRI